MPNRGILLSGLDTERRFETPAPPKPTGLMAFFCVFVVIGMAANIGDLLFFHLVVQPLLIPILMVFLYFYPLNVKDGKKIIVLGLLFSWIGDILLIFESFNSIFFVLGLIFYLSATISYTYYLLFINQTSPYAISFIHKQPWWVSIIIIYAFFLTALLFPDFTGIKILITIYTVIICTMLISALYVCNRINKPSGFIYILSALFFLISVSLVTINKFCHIIPYCGAYILLTYAIGQYFIIKGFTKIAETNLFYKQ
ncbi:MAG: lysoplasmalogenase [Chitinophagaceae bacterium]|nr:lysoplasmalogenase [Chitinophagaceae bacterium]